VLFFALLISYPWWMLTIGTIAYLASLPFGWLSYRNYERKDAATGATAATPTAAVPAPREAPSLPPAAPGAEPPPDPDRPARLN
jgi:CDP-diacylglycerol--serine O-phosphatidyltransferase